MVGGEVNGARFWMDTTAIDVVLSPAGTPPKSAAAAAADLRKTRSAAHPRCIVCGPSNPLGFCVDFTPLEGGGVEGVFTGSAALEGYPGCLHGGVIAALLDGAMTNCLFARGQVAYTGDLRIRFLHPVAASRMVTLRARVRRSRTYWHEVEAELEQDGVPKARATAWFINRRSTSPCTSKRH